VADVNSEIGIGLIMTLKSPLLSPKWRSQSSILLIAFLSPVPRRTGMIIWKRTRPHRIRFCYQSVCPLADSRRQNIIAFANDNVLYRSLSARIGILPDARLWPTSCLPTTRR
jgi:hypothetical protein